MTHAEACASVCFEDAAGPELEPGGAEICGRKASSSGTSPDMGSLGPESVFSRPSSPGTRLPGSRPWRCIENSDAVLLAPPFSLDM